MPTEHETSVNTADPAETTAGPAEMSLRPRRAPLTRERIIRTALQVMDEEGLEAVTMRRIGRELGVEAMSLYNHVRDKEDILDGVTEMVLGKFEFPPSTGDWAEDVRSGAREWGRLFQTHPSLCQLMAERHKPLESVEAVRPMEAALELLGSSGLGIRETVQAFNAFGGYIMGFVIMERGLMPGRQRAHTLDEHDHEELARTLRNAGVDLPRFIEALPYFAECPTEEQFEFGLDLLIRGLRSRVEEARAEAG